MSKKVLLTAYHYPPIRGSSGLHRTLAFSRYLSERGWQPTVLTTHPRAYRDKSDDLLDDIPIDVRVIRAFALDASRHLCIKGRYLRVAALPDAWSSWLFGGVFEGLRYCWQEGPDIIWSTYPIPTALVIGYILHRLTGIPWVTDFRDPMIEEEDPMVCDEWQRRAQDWLEPRVVRYSSRMILTAPSAVDLYSKRYSEFGADKFVLIENGYDENAFAGVRPEGRDRQGPVRLVHSGIIYPYARDPSAFFKALGNLKRNDKVSATNLKVVLRATGHDDIWSRKLIECGIDDIVELAPQIPYRAALAEMLSADGLIIMQASNSNYQIPAKIYEYIRARRPVLGLTDEHGDTGQVLRSAGIDTIARLDSSPAIEALLPGFMQNIKAGSCSLPSPDYIRSCDRRMRSHHLAQLLDEIVAERSKAKGA